MESNEFEEFYLSSGICTDTRAIFANCIFVCIKGDNFDGNSFAQKALEQGANHVIVDNETSFTHPNKMTLVADSITYIQQLANHHRRKFDIPVIGITGSNGKTTTKELIYAVLSKKFNVLATKGNLNNHLGVPFTLLRLTKKHEIAIIEMGANKLKDIEELCDIAEPTIGIITNIGKAHLEGFIDFEGILRTKCELYKAIENVNGKIVINRDDQILVDILPNNIEFMDYSTFSDTAINGELLALSPFVEMEWSSGTHQSKRIETKMVGKYNFYNYMAAISFGKLFKIENEAISEAIEEYTPTNNRSQVTKTERNTLIMDCYNANPSSMRSALDSFAMINNNSKVLILGDMKELGNDSKDEHEAIISLLESLQLNAYTVGNEYYSLQSSQIIRSFQTTDELLEHLSSNPLIDKLILLKGSRSMGLEKAQGLL